MTSPKRPLDAAVDAMLAEMRRQLRDAVEPPTISAEEVHDFFVGLENESDRAVAIVTHSFIDHSASQLIARDLWDGIKGGVKGLFTPFGPLGSANARLKVAGALFWIHPIVYKDLETLRMLRNKFAHETKAGCFDDPEMATLVDILNPWEQDPLDAADPSIGRQPNVSRRHRFIVRSAFVAVHTLCGLATAPQAIRRGLPPSTALVHGLEEAPPWYRDYLVSALKLMSYHYLVSPSKNWMDTG